MTAEVINGNITTNNGELEDSTVSRTSAEAVSTYVVPRLVESDLGIGRHRPLGEPGSYQGLSQREFTDRPDDN